VLKRVHSSRFSTLIDNSDVLPFFSTVFHNFPLASPSFAVPIFLMFSYKLLVNPPFDYLSQFPSRLYPKVKNPINPRKTLQYLDPLFLVRPKPRREGRGESGEERSYKMSQKITLLSVEIFFFVYHYYYLSLFKF
jgi:hypothetical protein